MKRKVSLFLVLVMLFSLCSCSDTGNKARFTVGVLDEIKTFNPYKAQGDSEKIISANCFEGLLRFNATGHIDPAGATGYSVSSDMLTYTFSLNPDAQWYISENAKAYTDKIEDFKNTITADDYIFALSLLKENYKNDIKIIKSITSPDDYTLKITLKVADRDFINTLASLPFYPCNKDFYKITGENFATSPDTIITNGIYYIDNISDTGSVSLKGNSNYNGNCKLLNKEIHLYPTGKEDALLTRFGNGDYDIFISENLQPDLGRGVTDPLYTTEIWGLSFNLKNNISKNVAFRKSIVSAIDFSKLRTPSFVTEKAGGIIPGNYTLDCEAYSSFENSLTFPEYSEENALNFYNNALSQLKENTLSIKIAIPTELKESFIEICTDLQRIFGKRLTVELIYFDVSEAEKIAKEGKYHIAVLPIKPKKATVKAILDEISSAPCFFKDKKLNELLPVNSPQTEKTAKSFMEAEKYIIKNVIFIPLFNAGTVLYISDYVTGIYATNNGETIYFHSGERIK